MLSDNSINSLYYLGLQCFVFYGWRTQIKCSPDIEIVSNNHLQIVWSGKLANVNGINYLEKLMNFCLVPEMNQIKYCGINN